MVIAADYPQVETLVRRNVNRNCYATAAPPPRHAEGDGRLLAPCYVQGGGPVKLGKFSGGRAIIPGVVIVYDFYGVITVAIICVATCPNLNGTHFKPDVIRLTNFKRNVSRMFPSIMFLFA